VAIGAIGRIDTGGVIEAERVQHEYQRRLDLRRRTLAEYERRHLRFSRLRLGIVAAAVGILIAGGLDAASWLFLPLGAFVITAVLHARLLNRRDDAASAVAFYERNVARTGGDWIGRGRTGETYAPAGHLFARDLDLFGRGGLFELLSAARTAEGEEVLARWLLHPAPPDEVRARQEAVRELGPMLDLREFAAVQGDLVSQRVNPSVLRTWALAPVQLRGRAIRAALPLLVAVTCSVIAAFVATDRYEVAALILLVTQSAIGLWFKTRTHAVVHDVDEPSHDLEVLAGLLAVLERHSFQSGLLRDLRGAIAGRPRPASREIARLSQWVALLSSRENIFFGPIAALLMWTTQWAFAIEAWRMRMAPDLLRWLDAVGTFEALMSLATFASEHPEYAFPELIEGPARLAAHATAHPVLPAGAVTNDVDLGGDAPRALVVSGSNMSGKSTLLRTLGVNVVLAQAGAPVRASAFRLSPLAVGAAIAIQDSLTDGRSKFLAEIQRLKAIVDLTRTQGGHTLFLLDEILGGTNSHDRRIGAKALLAGLTTDGAIGLATTHDLAISQIAERMAPHVANVHFVDEFHDGRLTFDYRLRPGVVQSSNAIALMRSIGLDV
jgi:hypothetical protein